MKYSWRVMGFVKGMHFFNGVRGRMLLCIHRCKNVLFNDSHNTFYLRLYGVEHTVKNHPPDSERGNPLPPLHRLRFPINSKGSFTSIISGRTAHTTAFVIPVVCKIE